MQLSCKFGAVALTVMALAASVTAAPIDSGLATRDIEERQNVYTPVANVTDLNLGDISPIEDGFLELDNDSGDGNDNGSTAVSNANGYLGTVGSGQAAENGNGVEGSSAACGLNGCATSAGAANNQSTSTSSSSAGGVNNNAPIISTGGAPLVSIGKAARRWLARSLSLWK